MAVSLDPAVLTTLAFCKLTCQTPPNHDHPHLPSPVSTHPMGGPNYRPTLSLEVVVRMIPTTLSDARCVSLGGRTVVDHVTLNFTRPGLFKLLSFLTKIYTIVRKAPQCIFVSSFSEAFTGRSEQLKGCSQRRLVSFASSLDKLSRLEKKKSTVHDRK